MNNQNRFDGKGNIYAKARPKYAAGLFEYLKTTLNLQPGAVFADIGSGTGIFTEQLLDLGCKVFAVEPNESMRIKAEEKLSSNPDFRSVNGSDENFNLPDQSVDFIATAQAFHWFDAEKFRSECKRTLKTGGKVIIVYNSRVESADCTKALAELRKKYNPEFHGFSNGMSDEKCRAFFDGSCEIFRADNTQIYDRQGYINRVLSSSYSLKETDEKFADYIKDINAIFGEFENDGHIAVPTDTVAYIGKL